MSCSKNNSESITRARNLPAATVKTLSPSRHSTAIPSTKFQPRACAAGFSLPEITLPFPHYTYVCVRVKMKNPQ